jgi:hypothetical protein
MHTNVINCRGRFVFASTLAVKIIPIPYLKITWNAIAIDGGSGYNILIGLDEHLVTPNSITDKTFLSPGIGFQLTASFLEFKEKRIHFVLDPFGFKIGVDAGAEML